MMQIDSVNIARAWVEIADSLSDEDRGRFYHAICRYAMHGEEPQFGGLLKTFFVLIQPQIDKSCKTKKAQKMSVRQRRKNSLQNDKVQNWQNDESQNSQNGKEQNLQNAESQKSQNAKTPSPSASFPLTPNNTSPQPGSAAPAREAHPKAGTATFADQLPEHLRTPEVIAKWKEWESYRSRKRKKVSPDAFAMQLKILEKLSAAEAIEAIDRSIANDWQGLFPPKTTRKAAAGKDRSGI